jgi:hypothetical protein
MQLSGQLLATHLIFFSVEPCSATKGRPGTVVKLLPCDHEVMGSSHGNGLLQKCREMLCTYDPKWSDPSPDHAQVGATCTGLPNLALRHLAGCINLL